MCSELRLYSFGRAKVGDLTEFDMAFRILPADQHANTIDAIFVVETDDHAKNTLTRDRVPVDKDYATAKSFSFIYSTLDHPVVSVLGVDTVERNTEGKIIGTHKFR
jgi:hypothetical protein